MCYGISVGNKKGLNARRQRIITEMRDNPNITTSELHQILGISETAVEKNLTFLKENGYVERVGSKKTGYWKVLEWMIWELVNETRHWIWSENYVTEWISALRNFADGLDRLRRILIRSCSAVPYLLKKWRRLQRRWMLDMSRRLCCRMEKK